MRFRDRKNPLIFVHIFRSGGNTLSDIIRRKLTVDECCRLRSGEEFEKEFSRLPKDRLNKIKFLDGHIVFGLHKYFSNPCDYITILRHPVSRIISQYYNILSTPALRKSQGIEKMSLEEYAESGVDIVSDCATRILIGLHPHSKKSNPLPQNALEIAKNNLQNHFKLVGVAERFDETAVLLKKIFGLNNAYYSNWHENSDRPAMEAVDDDAIKAIEKRNQSDLALYRYANFLMDEAVKNYDSDFGRDLSSFKRKNLTSSKILKWKTGLSPFLPSFFRTALKKIFYGRIF